MIIVENPFGQDPADFDDEKAAYRVGHRIRKIREARNMTLTELARKIDISADMLQKYENGKRKPKTERLKDIAYALKVSSLALTDPILTSYCGVMFALFELEEKHSLSIEKIDGRIYLTFSGSSYNTINKLIEKWYEKKESVKARMEGASEEEKKALKQEYFDWEWTFPKALVWKPSRDDKEKEREMLERRLKQIIEELKNDDT